MQFAASVYRRFSPTLWVLALARLVDMTTLWMAIPFMSLFLSQAGASNQLTGLVLALNPLAALFGNLVGGQLSDVRGRRPVLLFAMALRIGVLLGYAYATAIWHFAVLGFLHGLVNSLFQPAFTAAIADVTDPQQRPQAFGLSRVASNLGVGIGPLLGGLLGVEHQTLIFTIAAGSSLLAGLLIYLKVPETMPALAQRQGGAPVRNPARSPRDVLAAWATVFQDRALLTFVLAGSLSTLAYQQIGSTYALTLKDSLANYDQIVGSIWALNGLLVVLLQLPITWVFERFPMAVAAASGCLTFSLGYLLYGYAAMSLTPALIYAAAAVWTIGEVILAVPQSTYVADIAPESVRARYAGASSLPWAFGGVVGPVLGTRLLPSLGGPGVMVGAATLVLLAGALFMVAERERSRRLKQFELGTYSFPG